MLAISKIGILEVRKQSFQSFQSWSGDAVSSRYFSMEERNKFSIGIYFYFLSRKMGVQENGDYLTENILLEMIRSEIFFMYLLLSKY